MPNTKPAKKHHINLLAPFMAVLAITLLMTTGYYMGRRDTSMGSSTSASPENCGKAFSVCCQSIDVSDEEKVTVDYCVDEGYRCDERSLCVPK